MPRIEYVKPGADASTLAHPAFGRVEDALDDEDAALLKAAQGTERRKRHYQVLVRLDAEEMEAAEARRDRLNGWLGESGPSKITPLTLQDMARHGMLSKPLTVVEASPAYNAAFVQMKADLARMGNLLKAWIECGSGRWLGKASPARCPACGQIKGLLTVGRAPTAEESAEGMKLMRLIHDTLWEWCAKWPLSR